MTRPIINVTVAIRELGAPSQPWIYRQLDFMEDIAPQVVYWKPDRFAGSLKERFDCVNFDGPVRPITRSDPGRWVQRFANLPDGNFFATDRRFTGQVMDILDRFDSHVLLAHFGHTALSLLPAAERSGVPVVAHFHGTDLSDSLITNRWYRWSLKRCLNRFRHCIVVGAHQRDTLTALGMPPERVHLLPCGVPTERFRPASVPRQGPFRFATVARLVVSKGIDVSIRAFAEVHGSVPETELVIVGDGPERENLEALAGSLSLGAAVQFVGMKREDEVVRLLQDSDALLHHSLEHRRWVEGFGVAVAEASACGLPVVVSRSGGLVDQVVDGETGFIVPMGDHEAMATAMKRLCEDRDLARRMGRNGRERMIREYDSRSQAGRLRDILAGVARHPERPYRLAGDAT